MTSAHSLSRPRRSLVVLAGILDIVMIMLFAAVGRSSHARDATVIGLLETAWPFLAGLVIVWLVGRVWHAPYAIIRSGVPVWLGSLIIGMLLRLATGAGSALPFVLVATGSLLVLLVGWRVVAALIRAIRARGRDRHSA